MDTAEASSQHKSFSCTDCSKTFRRLPHLKRHRATIHNQISSHSCHVCGRKFNRQDSFQRHLITHGILRSPISGIGAGVGRKQRSACSNCSRAHARCSGGLPCSRCLRNALTCCHSPSVRPAGLFDTPNIDGNIEDNADANSPSESADVRDSNFGNHRPTSTLAAPVRQSNVQRWFASQLNWLPVLEPERILEYRDTTTATTDPTPSLIPARTTDTTTYIPAERATRRPSNLVQSQTVDVPSPITTTTASDLGPSVSSGGLYTHGLGSRGSQQQRPPIAKTSRSHLGPPLTIIAPHGGLAFGFPDFSVAEGDADPGDNAGSVVASSHSELIQMFRVLAVTSGSFYRPFETDRFPPIGYLDECISLFLRKSADDLAIVHPSVWHSEGISCLLILAACTVGALSHPGEGQSQTAYSFQELLRRAIRYSFETPSIQDEVLLFQAGLFNAFAATNLYETSSDAVQAAYADLEFLKGRSQACGGHDSETDGVFREQDTEWAVWIRQETRRRLVFFSWHLSFNQYLRGDATYRTDPCPLSLPCSQDLWNVESAPAWFALNKISTQPPSMQDILQALYIERHIPHGLDSRGVIYAIYGIINRTFQVSHQLRHPLGQWSPAPSLDLDLGRGSTEQIEWLPANSTYAGWRNSACDCLDLLHWRTHVETAANAGREGPTSLHLHLARLVLLTPFREIIDFASHALRSYKAGKGHLSIGTADSSEDSSECPRHIRTAISRWLTLDDHKGRLSIVHAGATFWHVRRFSRNSVYEPFTVFLATLVLWTYALYQPQVRSVLAANRAALSRYEPDERCHRRGDDNQGAAVSDDDDSDDPTSLLLDRPCDDEIIQLFIRKGPEIEPCMFGDVRICVGNGWRRVLKEGSKLLFHCRRSSYAKAYEYQAALLALTQDDQEL